MLSRKFIRPILHKIYDNVSWWRNGIVSTPLCTNSNIFGPPYRETSPHSMRMSSTNSICRDINSAGINKFGVAGPDVRIGLVSDNLMENYARYPSLKKQKFTNIVLEFELSEAIGQLFVVVVFLLLFGM